MVYAPDMAMSTAELRAEAEEALRKGDAPRARALIEGASLGGVDAPLWLLLARARAAGGDATGASAAIDGALAVAPFDISALIAKGDDLVLHGEARAASAYYGAALQQSAKGAAVTPRQQEDLQRAKAATVKLAAEFADFTRAHLEQRGFLRRDTPERFVRALDILVGKKRPYSQAPRQFYYPELPQIQFYPRDAFDWLEAVEGEYSGVRAELEAQIAEVDFDPYLQPDPTRPRLRSELMGNPAWGARFLIKEGALQPASGACPHALAAIAHAPAPRIAGRTPHALFSRLAAGAHIPPHTGMINVRLICHLALIVPEGCVFRVGNDVRPWVEGKAWVFDDTIEHEAWNRSARDRYVLLFDVWRPELSEDERLAVAALCEAVDAYGGAKTAWGDA